MIKQMAFAGVALASIVACSPSPNTTATDAATTAPATEAPMPAAIDPSMQTQDFANALTNANLLEISTGKVAQTKSRNTDVKAYATMLVRDHTAAQAKVTAWATAANVTTPAALDAPTQLLADNIANADATGFDDKYLDTVIDAHESAISKAETYARDGADSALKQIATDLLPTLRTHFDRAKAIREAVNKS
jgi:putative membrane protein